MPTLFSPDGIEVPASSPAEVIRLKARGYTAERPFVPAEHTVAEVLEHVEEHPEEAPAVIAAERQTKDRKGVVGA